MARSPEGSFHRAPVLRTPDQRIHVAGKGWGSERNQGRAFSQSQLDKSSVL